MWSVARLCTQFKPSRLRCARSRRLPFCLACGGKFVTSSKHTRNTIVPAMVVFYARGLVRLVGGNKGDLFLFSRSCVETKG